jgi:cytochrome c553
MKLLATTLLSAALVLSAVSSFAAGEAAPEAAKPEAVKAAGPDLAKGEATFASCTACHGADGNSVTPIYPRLAQQHPEYLVKQLKELKSGKRANAIMMGMAAGLSEDDMKNVAYWLASNKAKSDFAKDKELSALGERIYRGGIEDRHVAACAGCHSPNGAGIPSQFPRLAGQHAEYVASTLTAYRDGVRNNNIIMSQNASKLNDHEIRALADYISGLH